MNETRQIALSDLAYKVNSDYVYAMSVLSAKDTVVVYVEGWDDVEFWENLLSDFTVNGINFEVMPPVRGDLAKGKKVVTKYIRNAGRNLLLAIDSDFDWLFNGLNPYSTEVNSCPWILQTYAYSIENLQCSPDSLRSLVVKSTKSNRYVFDFETFFLRYSNIIYKLFLLYAWCAFTDRRDKFPLDKFAKVVAIYDFGYQDNGLKSLKSLERYVTKTYSRLMNEFHDYADDIKNFEIFLEKRGVTPTDTHYYMQGHALKDRVVLRLLDVVCKKNIEEEINSINCANVPENVKINNSRNYINSTRPVEFMLDENQGYKRTKYYKLISNDINRILKERGNDNK